MNATALTAADLDRMETDDRWLGFGYLGERRNLRAAIAAGEVDPRFTALDEAMDDAVLAAAAAEGLSYDELFVWANSKHGRWFADCYGTRHAADYLPSRSLIAYLGL